MPRRLLLALALLAPPALGQEATLALPPGAPDDLRTVLENASLTLSLDAEGLTDPQDYVAAARADYRRLLTGLYAEGYYGGTISITLDGREAAAIQPLDAPAAVARVVLSVTPGPRFTFGRAAIGPLAPATALPPGFAPGEVARSEAIRDAVRAAVAAWRAQGNAKAAVASQDIVALHAESRLDAAVAIAPGPRLSFGPVTVSGNERVRAERILAIAGIPTGAVFSPEALERAATRLRRTGAFDAATLVESDAVGPNDTLPIEVQVVESLPRRLGFSAEISSLDGVAATAFWLHRNLLGGAERLRVEAAVSGIEGAAFDTAGGGPDYALSLSFQRPATFAPDNDLGLTARLAREDAADFTLDSLDLAVTLTRYATDRLTLSGGLGLSLSRERTAAGQSDRALLTLPLTAAWDRRDDPLDARRGFYLAGEATPFLGVAGDAGSGARLLGDARGYLSFGRVTLAGRAQAGSVLGAGRDEVPQDFLFFSGGGGTVRGQPYQSLGVRVPDPSPGPSRSLTLGAASFLGAQAEARLGLTDRIGAVAFYDVGLTGPDAFPDFGESWQAGTGVGLRYRSPVGPIRLDLATPASGEDAFGALQVYIGIGQAF